MDEISIIIFSSGSLDVVKVGIEIAKAGYGSKNTDKSGTFAT